MRIFLLLFAFSCLFFEIDSFNISPVPNIVHSKPFTRPTDPKDRNAYFGFSMLLQENGLLVGAPRANSTLRRQSELIEPGSLYNCSIGKSEACNVKIVENRDNIIDLVLEHTEDRGQSINHLDVKTEIRDRQWFGATLAGDRKNNFIACAPFMHTQVNHLDLGACYISRNGNWEIFKPLGESKNNKGFKYYSISGALGFSSHWITNRNMSLLGAPNRLLEAGTFLRYNIAKEQYKIYDHIVSIDQALGYSITAATLGHSNRIFYIVAAPKFEYHGIVYIIDETSSGRIRKTLIGTQHYEYFGYSLLAEDLNNDGVSEIIVSAPFYTAKNATEMGAVYVHNGVILRNLSKPTLTAPRGSNGRFGFALASLGDINLDGFNDIAVSAPYDEHGKVYIYHGSSNGVLTSPSQILIAPSYPKHLMASHNFGFSISSQVDIDRNGLNDVAISALHLDKVFLYKTYPIVKVELFFDDMPESIHFTKSQIDIKVCIKFSSFGSKFKGNLQFKLILKLDQTLRRMQFDNKLLQQPLNLTSDRAKCIKVPINIVSHGHRQIPFTFQLDYTHVQPRFEEKFCDSCAVIHPNYRTKPAIEERTIRHQCNQKVCNSDLKISAQVSERNLLLSNDTQEFNISLVVESTGDEAYLPQVIVENNHNLSLAFVPPYCFERNPLVVCSLFSGQKFVLENNEKKTVNLTFDISALKGSKLMINATVTSLSNEVNASDNTAIIPIDLFGCQHIDIIETSDMQTQLINLFDDQTMEIDSQKTFEITVKPRLMSELVVHILFLNQTNDNAQFPIQVVGEKFYINSDGNLMKDEVTRLDHILDFDRNGSNNLTPSSRNPKFMEQKCTRRTNSGKLNSYEAALSEHLDMNQTLNFNVSTMHPSDLEMRSYLVSKSDSFRGNSIKFTIQTKIDQKAVRRLLDRSDKKFLFYKIGLSVQNVKCKNELKCTPTHIDLRTLSYGLIISRIKSEKSSTTIYIASIVLGLIIYLIISFILFKLGFFQRKKHEEMKSIKRTSVLRQTSVAQSNYSFEMREDIDRSSVTQAIKRKSEAGAANLTDDSKTETSKL